MIHLLAIDRALYPHLTDKIFRHIKDDFNRKLKHLLTHNVVWMLHSGGLGETERASFLIPEDHNYYRWLDVDDNSFEFHKL